MIRYKIQTMTVTRDVYSIYNNKQGIMISDIYIAISLLFWSFITFGILTFL